MSGPEPLKAGGVVEPAGYTGGGGWRQVGFGGRGPRKPGAARPSLAIVLAIALLCTSGCWNRREIEDLAFVSSVGVDYEPETRMVDLTTHVVKPKVSEMETGFTEKSFLQVASSGLTVFEAVRNAIQQVQQRLFWAHNKVLVIGEETARQGVTEILDFFVRDGETRHDVMVVVAKGTTANDLLKSEYELDTIPGTAMARHIESVRNWLSTSVAIDLHEFTVRLHTPGTEALATRVEAFAKMPGDPSGELMREHVLQSVFAGGAAVFRGDRLVGWLEPLETRGLMWLQGEVRSGIMVIPDPWHGGRHISLQLVHSHRQVKFTQDEDGKLTAWVMIQGFANLGDVQGPIDPLRMADFEAQVHSRFEEQIRAEADSALLRCQQELRSDVFGFGADLHRQNPELWRQLEGQWEDIFPEIEVEVEARGRVLRSGTSSSSTVPR